MKRLVTLALLSLFAVLPTRAQNNSIAQRPFGQQTVAFSATPTFDASKSLSFKITLTGNVTSSTLIGAEAGQTLQFDVCQDGAGSHTFAFPSQMVGAIAILSGANVCTQEIFVFDGASANIPTTTTAGGGGSGTVNAGTAGHLTYYAASGTTVSSDPNLDDGATTPNTLTYSGTGGIASPQYTSNGTGAMTFAGTEGTCSGAAVGKDVICVGDATSHSVQGSQNGSSFSPFAEHQSTSPTPHGLMVAETFPQMFAIPTGSLGQPFLSGGASGDPGAGALNLAGGSTIVTGILPKLNHPTSTVFNDQTNTFVAAGTLDLSAATASGAFRAPNIAGVTPTLNGAIAYDSTSNNFHGGLNGADSKFASFTAAPANNDCPKWVVSGGNILLGTTGAACASGASPVLSSLLAATTANSINNGDNAQTWNASLTTASKHFFTFTENSASVATGTPYLVDVHSIASSTANPLTICALGTTNCWNFLNTGLLTPTGSAGFAAPGTNGQLLFNNAGTIAAEDPVVSQAFVNVFNAISATGTQTSSAVRNPVFSQTGTFQITWASITGSPATCTLQMEGVDSLGNVLANGGTFSVSPANGTTSQTFTAASTLQTAAQVKVIYACVTYPTTGTLSLDFTPIPNVNVTNTVAVSGTVTTTPPSNASTNVAQLAGTATDTNSGNKSAGTLRVVLATDQPQLTNKLLVTPDANVKVNIVGNAGANVDQAPGSAIPANAVMEGLSDGTNTRFAKSDPTGRQFMLGYPDTTTTSYHASKNVASAATATDISVLPGNATNTVLVNRVIVSCTQTTAGIITLQLIKRSTADTAGTSSSMTVVPDDANYAAGVSAPLVYTANPTTGTAIGNVDTASVGCMASATASPNDIYVFRPAKPIVLRGTAQQLAVNLNSTTVTGGSFNVTFEYEETTTP